MNDQELLTHLCELEVRAMLAAGADPATIDALLTEDFFEFGRSGKRWEKAGILGMQRSAGTHAGAGHFALTRLGEDHALLTYISTLPGGGDRTLRSSIWKRQLQGWRMCFHQGTPQP